VGGADYSEKIFNGKTFTVSKNPREPQKFSPSNDLTYTVFPHNSLRPALPWISRKLQI